jgi:hypothetical protein
MIKLIINKINEVSGTDPHILKAKNQRIEYYKTKDLKSVTVEMINKYDFSNEVLSHSQNILKANLLTKKVYRLERHLYAPEMNKLHLKSGATIATPQKTEIIEAILYCINQFSYEQIKCF